MSEVPLDDRELPMLFHARTADFQDVTVQATVTYRITDPVLAATGSTSHRHRYRSWRASPLEQVAGLLTQSAQQHGMEVLAGMELAAALIDGSARAGRCRRAGGRRAAGGTGIVVIGVRVVALRAEPDVERALQTPTPGTGATGCRQGHLRTAGHRRPTRARHRRERTTNQIELAKREEELVGQRGQNRRREAETQAEAGRIETRATAERTRILADADAGAARVVGMAAAEVEAAQLDAYRALDTATVMALALKELAGNLPEIGMLNLTPDLLTPILARLGGSAPGVGGGQ